MIPNSIFYCAENLTTVTLPNTIKKIEQEAFYGCKSLESIELSEGVTSISANAFNNCLAMKSVTVPKSVTYIGTRALGYSDSNKIDNFVINGYKGTDAQRYANENNITFNDMDTVLVGDTNKDKSVNVADVTYLQMYLAGETTSIDINNMADIKRADLNGDGNIDVLDVTEIQNLIAS